MIKGEAKHPPKTRFHVPSPPLLPSVLVNCPPLWRDVMLTPNNGIVRDGTNGNPPPRQNTPCFVRPSHLLSHISQTSSFVPIIHTCNGHVKRQGPTHTQKPARDFPYALTTIPCSRSGLARSVMLQKGVSNHRPTVMLFNAHKLKIVSFI
jgi:hypothetical protein